MVNKALLLFYFHTVNTLSDSSWAKKQFSKSNRKRCKSVFGSVGKLLNRKQLTVLIQWIECLQWVLECLCEDLFLNFVLIWLELF